MKLRQKPKYFMVSCKNTVCTVHMVYKYVHTVGYWYLFREKKGFENPTLYSLEQFAWRYYK